MKGRATVVAATVAAGILAASAYAADLGTVDGVNYQKVSTSLMTGNSVSTVQACPAGKIVTGGGFGTAALGIKPSALWPADGADSNSKPDDAYQVFVSASGNETLDSYAICADLKAKYVTKDNFAEAAAAGKVTAKCPRDRHLVGGGASAGSKLLASSYPYDSRDKGKKPDDGWKATVNGANASTFSAVAVCTRDQPTYRTRTIDLVPSQGSAAIPACKGNTHLTALGAHITGPVRFGDLREMRPRDLGDADSIPEDDALVNMGNSGTNPDSEKLTGWAICVG